MRISKEGYGLKSYRHEISQVTKMGCVTRDSHHDRVNKDLLKLRKLCYGSNQPGTDADEPVLVLHAGVVD